MLKPQNVWEIVDFGLDNEQYAAQAFPSLANANKRRRLQKLEGILGEGLRMFERRASSRHRKNA